MRLWFTSLLCLLATAFYSRAEAANFYVSNAGSNANPGNTTASPWGTIQFALSHVAPGDVINVMAGTYTGRYTWVVSGTAGAPVTLRNNPGDLVILDGSTLGNGVEMLLIQNKAYIQISGLHFTGHNGNYQPVIHLLGNCSHVEISNCEIYDTNCNESYGVLCEGRGDDISIHDNDFHDLLGSNAVAILFAGSHVSTPYSNVQIVQNNINHIEPAPSEGIAVNGNVDGFVIEGNNLSDINNIGIAMIGGEDWVNTNDAVNYSRNGVCRNNTVSHANSIYGGGFAGGIYIDGGSDIVLENNIVTGSDIGIEVGCENAGFIAQNNRVRNNILYANEKAGLAFGGYDYPATGQVQNCSFTGNTVFDNDILNSGFGQLWIQYAWNCTVRNNIFYVQTVHNMVNAQVVNATMGNMITYNIFHHPAGDALAKYFWNGGLVTGLSAFQSLSGTATFCSSADPLFVNVALSPPDLHIQNASPCINAGDPAYTLVDTTDVDMDGDARILATYTDIGADEFATFPLVLSYSVSNAICSGTCTGSISFTGMYGCTPYTLQYKAPGGAWTMSDESLHDLCAGNYKVKVTDACGLVLVQNIPIAEDPALSLTVTSIVNETVPGAANGKISVKANGGYGTKQYSIDAGAHWQTTKKFTGLPAGSYTIWTMDAHACMATAMATVESGMRLAQVSAVVFPNPCHDRFTIQLDDYDKYRVEIYSATGALLQAENVCGAFSHTIACAYPPGLYILHIILPDNSLSIQLILE
ncbi:MAG: right-handed parallel beta-helix repeat-containing protein [Chitinophagales bacterium]